MNCRTAVVAVIAMLLWVIPANAAVVAIDTFNYQTVPCDVEIGGVSSQSADHWDPGPITGVAGGKRYFQMEGSQTEPVAGYGLMEIAGDELVLGSQHYAAGYYVTWTLQYGYDDASGTWFDINFDATAANDRFRMYLSSNDQGCDVTMTVTDDSDTVGVCTEDNVAAGVDNIDLLFGDFVTGGAALNFNHIKHVDLVIVGRVDEDLHVELLGAIPEPATMSVLLVGAAALLRRRRA